MVTKTATTMGATGYGTVTPTAYPKFFEELDKNFPGAMPYEEYLVASKYLLSRCAQRGARRGVCGGCSCVGRACGSGGDC